MSGKRNGVGAGAPRQFAGSVIAPREVSSVVSYSWLCPTIDDLEWILRNSNDRNRNLSEKTVASFVSDFLTGAWFDGGAFPILFGPDGELLDGQHRVAALRRALEKGCQPVWLRIGHVADAEAARRIRRIANRGRPDTVGSVLEKDSVFDKGDGNQIAAIVSSILQFELGDSLPLTPARCQALYEREREGIDLVMRETSPRRFNASVRGALAYAYPISGEEIGRLVRVVAAGAGFEAGSVADLFCRALDIERGGLLRRGKSGSDRASHFCMTLRLVKAHVRGETLQRLQRTTDGVDWVRSERSRRGLSTTRRDGLLEEAGG